MSIVDSLPGASAMEGLLNHRPQLSAQYRVFYESFWRDGLVPRRVLALTRLRIAYIHSCVAELQIVDAQASVSANEHDQLSRGHIAGFSESEQSALKLAEQMPHSVQQITDDQVQAAAQHFGHPGCVALLTALAFFDVNCRLKLVYEIPALESETSPECESQL